MFRRLVFTFLFRSLLHKRAEFITEFLQYFLAEFFAEVAGFDPSGLDLQDHFTNQKLMFRDRQSAVDRKLAALQHFKILFPLIVILIMNALEMAKAGHARGDHVGPMP